MTTKKKRQRRRAANRERRMLAEGSPSADKRMMALSAAAQIVAEAPAEGEKASPPKFAMTAYTGGMMRLRGWPLPVVIDIAGMKAKQRVPILYAHSDWQVCGQSTEVKKSASRVDLTGVITGEDELTQGIIAHARNGFVWSASVGVQPLKIIEVKAGQAVQANGRTYMGPLYLTKASELQEVSILAIGADKDAETRIAASAGDSIMTFEQWLQNAGFDIADMSETQQKFMRAAYDRAMAADDGDADPAPANPTPARRERRGSGAPKPTQQAAADPAATPEADDDPVAKMNAAAAANMERIAAIQKVCGEKHAAICAQAVREGWSAEKTELAVLRAARDSGPRSPAVLTGAGSNVPHDKLLEAAACQSLRLADVEKQFDSKVLEASHRAFRGRLGLKRLLIEAARANGCPHTYFDDEPREVMQAAFSSASISTILSNIANKTLLESFNNVENVYSRIAEINPVNDLKAHTFLRLTASGVYEEVPATGQLQHGTMTEESQAITARTFGMILTLARKDIINDDLNALRSLTRQLGANGGRTVNKRFWTKFLDNAAFFLADNNNYLEGATTALGHASLGSAVQLFRDQTDGHNQPMAISPKLLLVPTALEGQARSIFASDQIRDTTASKLTFVANIYKGTYEVLVSSYLGNTAFSGASSLAWYLLASAMDLPVMRIAALYGNLAPTIESVDAAPDVLGINLRAYHDFDAEKAEHRAGVKVKGEA